MPWARLDDSFHSHPKTVSAWHRCPAAVGLFARVLSWVADHSLDGKVPAEVLEMWMPSQSDRAQAIEALVDAGLFEKNGQGFVIHDFLAYNPSKADVEARREHDRKRKRG